MRRCPRAGSASAAVAAGASDARQVKQLTRAGMGWCQGRMWVCRDLPRARGSGRARGPAPVDGGPTAYAPVERLVATPIPLGALAAAEFEAKGNSAM